jgi:hypothetical protein
MALVAGTMPNMFNGVSQQPPALRLQNSCTEMENGWASLVAGLQKRPGSEIVARLGNNISGNIKGHFFQRFDGKKFFINVQDNDIKVYDETGSSKTVNGTLSGSYLDFNSNPRENCKMITVGDTTFILNRTVNAAASTIAESSITPARLDPDRYWSIFIKGSLSNSNYAIYVNNVLKANFTTGANTEASNAVERTEEIAQELVNDLSAAGYTVARYNSTISLYLASTDVVTIDEGNGGNAMTAFKDELTSFEDLPAQDKDGRLVRIIGEPGFDGDDYYVVYQDGLWIETHGYGKKRQLTASTLPHTLSYDASTDSFTFDEHTWAKMLVGDDTTNADPTFVGKPINDIFIHQGRMGFLADENVIMSEADYFENFFRTTVAQLVDADPIDIAAVTGQVTLLNFAVPFNKKLLVFSDRTQYILETLDLLSPKTAQLNFASAFNCSKTQTPVQVGAYIYFADDTGTNSKLMEYFVDNDLNTENADEVSAQIPEYIKSPVQYIGGSSRLSSVFLLGSNPNELYCYKYFQGTQGKIQSSWGKWIFEGDVKYFTLVDNDMFLLVDYDSDGLYMEKINIEEDSVRSSTSFPIHLDHSFKFSDTTRTYDAATGLTTFTLPHPTPATAVFVQSDADAPRGITIGTTRTNSTTFTAIGDYTGSDYDNAIIGRNYTFRYEYSPFFLKEDKGQGQVAIQDGRLSVRYVSVQYEDTAQFTARVTNRGRTPYEYTFSGRNLGSGNNTLGGLSLDDGEFKFPVMGENLYTKIELLNDTPFHCTFTGTEWNAQWTAKAVRRV